MLIHTCHAYVLTYPLCSGAETFGTGTGLRDGRSEKRCSIPEKRQAIFLLQDAEALGPLISY